MVMTLISELGNTGIGKFPNSKAFSSFVGAAPNDRISGGKKLAGKKSYKSDNLLKNAFLHCANTIGNSKFGFLKNVHTKMCFRMGRSGANKVVARKLAVIIFHMLSTKKAYKKADPIAEQEKMKRKTLNLISRKAKKHGITLKEIKCLIQI